MPLFDRIIKILASLKLAVVIILSLGVISAVGTIVEAKYGEAEIAQKLVYQSIYMYITLIALCVSLIAVMIDRWPWKQHHAAFVLAHIGIIILIMGAWFTQKYGVDGSIAFNIGEEKNFVTLHDRELLVFASFGGNMTPLFDEEVDFLTRRPTSEKPFVVRLGNDELRFTDYMHFAYREGEILPTDLERDGPAVRFQLENPNVNVTEWLRRDSKQPSTDLDLGPAKVVLTSVPAQPSGRNEIILTSLPGKTALRYTIYNKDKSLRKSGEVKQGETLETGWMGLKFRLLRYLPHSKEQVSFVPAPHFTPVTTSAAKFTFRGEEYWIGMNSAIRLYLQDMMYIVSYGYRRVPLQGLSLKLKDFRVGNYQGTERAASYESQVEVPGRGEITISMNEPLKHKGFTFYQASFEKDERGRPVTSILSVNYDPGRWLKYLGSFLIVLGTILLFYFKRVKWIKKRSA